MSPDRMLQLCIWHKHQFQSLISINVPQPVVWCRRTMIWCQRQRRVMVAYATNPMPASLQRPPSVRRAISEAECQTQTSKASSLIQNVILGPLKSHGTVPQKCPEYVAVARSERGDHRDGDDEFWACGESDSLRVQCYVRPCSPVVRWPFTMTPLMVLPRPLIRARLIRLQKTLRTATTF